MVASRHALEAILRNARSHRNNTDMFIFPAPLSLPQIPPRWLLVRSPGHLGGLCLAGRCAGANANMTASTLRFHQADTICFLLGMPLRRWLPFRMLFAQLAETSASRPIHFVGISVSAPNAFAPPPSAPRPQYKIHRKKTSYYMGLRGGVQSALLSPKDSFFSGHKKLTDGRGSLIRLDQSVGEIMSLVLVSIGPVGFEYWGHRSMFWFSAV